MDYLIVDESKCQKDGICAGVSHDCHSTPKEDGYPEIARDGICLVCGHCVAVCPHEQP